jgi:predicted DNA-binding protein
MSNQKPFEDEISFLSEESKYLQACIAKHCDELEDYTKRLGTVLRKIRDVEEKKAVSSSLTGLGSI